MATISTHALTRTFGPVTAVSNLTVDLPSGVVGLVGANGAGKSTLIKILLGLMPPSSGTASILGLRLPHRWTADPRSRWATCQRVIAFRSTSRQPSSLCTWRACPGCRRTAPASAPQTRLRHVGLYEERYRPIGGYSTGMKQRVKLAQSLVHDPKLVFLDEPTNGLDPAGRDEMLELIARVSSDFGIAVVVTSHLLGELERISDHIVVIEAGVLQRSTSMADATQLSGSLLVEVTDRADDVIARLAGARRQRRHQLRARWFRGGWLCR